MGEAITLNAFVERADGTDGASGYVAGLTSSDGGEVWLKLSLPAEIVECAVLRGARLSIMMSPSGRLAFDAEGLSDEALEVATDEAASRDLTVETLVRACLDPTLLKGEDNLSKDLDVLHGQLERALQIVDETRKQLNGPLQS